MAEAIAGPLLGKLQELALNEAQALVNVKHDIQCLRDRLVWLQAFLLEVDPIRRVDGNLLTGVLVTQTRAVALDSEDAIDEYLVLKNKIASRRGWWRVVPALLERFAQHFLVRHYLSLDIKILNDRIEAILHSKEKYKLDDLRTGLEAAAATSSTEPRPNWTLPAGHGSFDHHIPRRTECDLICREKEKDKLKDLLEDPDWFLIFIKGDSGVGKTTLMRSAYNDRDICAKYDVRIWIDFPPGTPDTTIRSEIIKQNVGVRCVRCSAIDSDSSSKRLVVIDCNHVKFTGLRMSEWLPDIGKQDKIVLITSKVPPALEQGFEQDGVERYVALMNTPSLGKEDVRLLFYYKLLGTKQPVSEEEKGGEGKGPVSEEEKGGEGKGSTGAVSEEKGSRLVSDVLKVTAGLPRAVVMLAQLLRRTEKSSWYSVVQHICKTSKVEKRLQRILLLSFNALPNDLKSCFLYLAGFRPETAICTQELVRLWAAEGFLCPKDGRSMEFVGHGNLKELIARDLVQVVTKDDLGLVQSVAIASYVHSFLSLEARESSFLDVHHKHHAPDGSTTVRRLFIPAYEKGSAAFVHEYPKLRSLMSKELPKEQAPPGNEKKDEPLPVGCLCSVGPACHGARKPISKVFRGSPYLRVISLEGHNLGKKMPTACVSNKVHLRYLRVESRDVAKIPESIADLPRLQTLDVRGTKISQLPDGFWKIETLRHVLGDSLLCPDPASTSNLRNLQTFETMSLEGINKWDGIRIMSKMLNLDTLAIKGLNCSHDLFPALSKLTSLKRLRLYGEVKLGSIGLDNHNLVLMELTGKLNPEGNVDFQRTSKLFNLSVLKLKDTYVDQDFISNIAHLPNLEHLSLLDNSFDKEVLEIPKSGYSHLKVLKVSGLDKLTKIDVNAPLSKLQTFQLIACKKVTIAAGTNQDAADTNQDLLQIKPSFSGGRFIYSLVLS